MEQKLTLVVKRHAEGYNYVPFDRGQDGEEHPYKAHFLKHLIATGHGIEPLPDGGVKLLSGPHA